MRLILDLLLLLLPVLYMLPVLSQMFDFTTLNPQATQEEREYMIKSAAVPGTISLPSGLQYRVITSGSTDWELFFPTSWFRRQPTADCYCSCYYTGRTIRGKVFETSDRGDRHEPLEVQPREVIAGWREALLLMKEGDHWELVIPSALGFGQRTLSHLHVFPEPVLIFDIKLIQVRKEEDALPLHRQILVLCYRHPLYVLVVALLSFLFIYLRTKAYDERAKNFVALENFMDLTNNPKVYMEIAIGESRSRRIEMELFSDLAPRTVENFRCLCTGERGNGEIGVHTYTKPLYYKNSHFHRVIPGFMVQGGDFTHGSGVGGESIYGGKFADEFNSGTLSHDRAYLLSMANAGPNTNGSQFFITLAPSLWLDHKHVVFGQVTSGRDVVTAIERVGSRSGCPRASITIVDCGEVSDEKLKNIDDPPSTSF